MSETIDFIDMVPEDLEIGGEPDYNDMEFYSLNEFMKTLPFDYFGDGSATEPFISKKKTSIIDTIRKDILATKAGIPIGETAEVVHDSQGFTKSEKNVLFQNINTTLTKIQKYYQAFTYNWKSFPVFTIGIFLIIYFVKNYWNLRSRNY